MRERNRLEDLYNSFLPGFRISYSKFEELAINKVIGSLHLLLKPIYLSWCHIYPSNSLRLSPYIAAHSLMLIWWTDIPITEVT